MPDADPELIRLLDEYRHVCERAWVSAYRVVRSDRERAALLDYIAAQYVRRDRLYADGPHDPDDGSADAAALEAEGDR